MKPLVALALLVGCVSSRHSTPPLTVDDVPAAYAKAVCEQYQRCDAVEDLAACEEQVPPMRLLSGIAPSDGAIGAVHAGKLHFDPEAATACIAELTQGCYPPSIYAVSAPGCDRMLTGAIATGASCVASDECISGECVGFTPACFPGTCFGSQAPAFTPGLGDACDDTPGCELSYCDPATQHCVALVAPGGACTSAVQCDHTTCDTKTGTCTPLGAEGEPCQGGCRNLKDYCAVDGICHHGQRLGEPCTQYMGCEPFDVCDFATGTCVIPADLGEDCSVIACMSNLSCDPQTSTCKPRPAVVPQVCF